MKFNKISALVLALSTAGLAHAAPVVINAGSTTSYSQSFDTLTTSTTASTWGNDSTLAGWNLFTAAGAPITTYVAGTGSSSTGSFYSFGASTASDRALGSAASGGAYFGSPASGATAGYIALALTNAGTSAISSFTLSYDGEQWRNGGNATAQSLTVQYGFGSSFAAVTSLTAAGSAFNFTSPVATATETATASRVQAGLSAPKLATATTPCGVSVSHSAIRSRSATICVLILFSRKASRKALSSNPSATSTAYRISGETATTSEMFFAPSIKNRDSR